MTRKLSKATVLSLLEIGGAPGGTIKKGHAKAVLGDEFDRLCDAQAMLRVGELKDVAFEECGRETRSEVIRRDGKNMVFSRSDGWVAVLDDDVALYKFDFEWLVKQIMHALNIPSRCNAQTILHETIWLLGRHRIENQHVAIVIVRNITDSVVFGALSEHLTANHKSHNPALVLSLDQRIPGHLKLPNSSVLVRLEEAIVIESDHLEMNTRMLSGRLGGTVRREGFSVDYKYLIWNGIEYTFTRKQAEAMEYMHDAGGPRHQDEILAGINCPQKRLLYVFRSKGKTHPAWGTVIKTHGKGFYYLDA